jgi:hypothetical protein
MEERNCGPREGVITGERGQRAAVIMVREVNRRETGCGKVFLFEAERCCGAISDRDRAYAALNRILEVTKMQREPVWALSEQNERWGAVLE